MIIYNYNKNYITENNKKNKMFMEFNDFVLREQQKGEDEHKLRLDAAKLSEALAFKIDDIDIYRGFEEGRERRQRYQKIFKKAGIVKRKKLAYNHIKELVEEQSFQNPQWNLPMEWETFDEAIKHFDPRFTNYSWLNFFIATVDEDLDSDEDWDTTELVKDRPYIVGSSNSPTHAGGKRKSKIIRKSIKKKKKTKRRKRKTRKKKVKKSE